MTRPCPTCDVPLEEFETLVYCERCDLAWPKPVVEPPADHYVPKERTRKDIDS